MATLAALLAAVWTIRNQLRRETPEIRRLAVLPLANLTGDERQAYFVDGMHEALVTELSQIPDLTVISRQSTVKYRGTDRAVPVIARELGVDALLEGSVFRGEDSIRITVQLIRADPEGHTRGARPRCLRPTALVARLAPGTSTNAVVPASALIVAAKLG